MRVIQYAAASRFNHYGLWNTGRPVPSPPRVRRGLRTRLAEASAKAASRAMTPEQDTRSHSRGSLSPESCKFIPPSLDGGRRESRALAAPAAPRAKGSKRMHTGLTGTAEASRLSPRNGFTTYTCSPRGAAFLAPVVREETPAGSARVAAPGPHDFAVRGWRFVGRETRLTQPRPSQPAPTFRDDASRPLLEARAGRTYATDLPDGAMDNSGFRITLS